MADFKRATRLGILKIDVALSVQDETCPKFACYQQILTYQIMRRSSRGRLEKQVKVSSFPEDSFEGVTSTEAVVFLVTSISILADEGMIVV